jgi:hypothetical protein
VTIKHHVLSVDGVDSIGWTCGVTTIHCDSCGTYAVAKSSEEFRFLPVFHGWSFYGLGDAHGLKHTCPRCTGQAQGAANVAAEIAAWCDEQASHEAGGEQAAFERVAARLRGER